MKATDILTPGDAKTPMSGFVVLLVWECGAYSPKGFAYCSSILILSPLNAVASGLVYMMLLKSLRRMTSSLEALHAQIVTKRAWSGNYFRRSANLSRGRWHDRRDGA